MPTVGGVSRPEFVGQINGLLFDIPENSPWDFVAGKADSTAVDCFGIRPKPATSGAFEEITRFNVYPLVLPAGDERQGQRNDLRKRKLAVSGKVCGGLLGFRINIFGDKVEKRFNSAGQLAWFFKGNVCAIVVISLKNSWSRTDTLLKCLFEGQYLTSNHELQGFSLLLRQVSQICQGLASLTQQH